MSMNTLLKTLLYTLLLVQMWGKVHWAVMMAIVLLAVETEAARLALSGLLDIVIAINNIFKHKHDTNS